MRAINLAGTCLYLLLSASFVSGQSEKPFAVMPSSEARRVSNLCSRTGVPNVHNGWEPTKVDIDALESNLSSISKLTSIEGIAGIRIARPASYYRQYVGITVAERKLIYVNAFSDEKPPSNWRKKLADRCDGGTAAWGVLYDPVTHEFSALATNGVA